MSARILFVTASGWVSFEGLSGVEIHIFDKATDPQFGRFPFTLVHAIAERLGFTVETIPNDRCVRADDPFSWLDLRYGDGGPFNTPVPEGGRVAHFIKVEGQMEESEKRARGIAIPGDRSYTASIYRREPPAGGWPEVYLYELDPEGLSPLERDLIGLFLPRGHYSGGTGFDHYFQMHIRGAAEVARRLGLNPVFEEEIRSSK